MSTPPHTVTAQEFNVGDEVVLGTLYLPAGDGWYPCAVLVGDPPAAGLTPFLLGLGFAVLTFDAPGASLPQAALAAADSLLMRPDIRPELIGLLGFGPGAWAAALAAARAPETAFAVLIPGTTPAPAADLPRLAHLDCPVLALLADDATAATLAEHLAHNDALTLVRVAADSHGRGLLNDELAALGPWLQGLTA